MAKARMQTGQNRGQATGTSPKPKKRRKGAGVTVAANYYSKCGRCSGPIHKGDLVVKRGKRWSHKVCVIGGPVTVTYAEGFEPPTR